VVFASCGGLAPPPFRHDYTQCAAGRRPVYARLEIGREMKIDPSPTVRMRDGRKARSNHHAAPERLLIVRAAA
jgi:hypothetical protein